MPPSSATSLKSLRAQYLQLPIGCTVALVAIHLMPKDPGDQDFRFILTVSYFGALGILLYSLTGPRSNYMKRMYEWKYQENGPAIQQAARLYLKSLDRLMGAIATVVGAFALFSAIKILALWPMTNNLQVILPVAGWGWWISLLGLVMLPVAGGNLFSETFQRRRLLEESIEISWTKPKDIHDLDAAVESETESRPAVEATGDLSFRAGGHHWHWSDFFKNSIVFGMTGTGKTVCLLNAVLDGLLSSSAAAGVPCAGLILDPKGDFHNKIQAICALYGRERDLMILDPYNLAKSIRWNPFDSDDDELELSARFAAVLECLGQKGGDNDAFWISSAQKFVRHSIALLRLTNRHGEAPNFQQINDLSVSFKRISERFDLMDDDDGHADQALSYFSQEWFDLADNTRTSILAYITNMVDPFLMHPYDELFGERSTARIGDMVDAGKILYVHMPLADKPQMARVISTFVKLEYYREILKRLDKKRTSFFLCDEFQQFFTTMHGKGDADFFERSRQSRHANIIASQNFPGLLKAAGDKESIVKNLLGNCAVKIFLRNTDDQTNKYASELFGQDLVRMVNASIGSAQGRFAIGGSSSQSSNAQYDNRVRPEEFIRLAVPSQQDGIDYAESIVHLASRAEVTHERLRWRVHPIV